MNEDDIQECEVSITVKYRGTDHQQGLIDSTACNLEISLIEFIEQLGAEIVDE